MSDICKSRASYITRAEAKRASHMIAGKHGKVLFPFPCPLCGKYHLGKNRDSMNRLAFKNVIKQRGVKHERNF